MDAVLASKPPKLLSVYGLFSNLRQSTPTKRVRRYEVRNELFSDHAVKSRYVFVPEGKAATYHSREAFTFPVGSVLVKTFSFPADLREPVRAVTKIETRLLLRQKGGWKAYAYVWNKQQTDAVLKIAGKRLEVEFIDQQGAAQSISYKVPNKNQCKGCHAVNKTVVPIGPKARNLNFEVQEGAKNQLFDWVQAGIVADTPPQKEWPSVPDWRNTELPIDNRARAYLDINCAHCHRSDGPASNTGLFLTYGETNRTHWGYRKRPVAAGRGSGGFDFAIAPGHPDRSILLYRMKSQEPGVLMPELGRSLTDDNAIRLLSSWIKNMH